MVQNGRESERWHVGKEIPIALIIALFVQTSGAIWWAATQSQKLDNLTELIKEFKSLQYTQDDARKDQAMCLQRYLDNARRIEALEEAQTRRSRV